MHERRSNFKALSLWNFKAEIAGKKVNQCTFLKMILTYIIPAEVKTWKIEKNLFFEKILIYVTISLKTNKSELKLQTPELLCYYFIKRFISNRLLEDLFSLGLKINEHPEFESIMDRIKGQWNSILYDAKWRLVKLLQKESENVKLIWKYEGLTTYAVTLGWQNLERRR